MPENRFYSIALIFLVVVLGYFSYEILKPFISPIAWGIVLTIVFYPVYLFILRFVRWKPLASVITVLLILFVLLVPLSYLSYLISQELTSLLNSIGSGKFDPVGSLLHQPAVTKVVHKVLSIFKISEAELNKTIADNISRLGKESVGNITSGLGNVASAAVDFIFVLLSIFFFLEGGPEFLKKTESYLPFPEKQRNKLIRQTRDIVVSTIYGGVTVAVVQGALGGIAFSVLGMPSPVLWGLTMFIASFIPLLGTFIVWGPASVYLFFHGLYLKGTILILIGVFAISAADNILRPLIIRGKMKMPTLAIFFSILGGIKLFGFIGFIMGPLVLALFVSIVEILRFTGEQQE